MKLVSGTYPAKILWGDKKKDGLGALTAHWPGSTVPDVLGLR